MVNDVRRAYFYAKIDRDVFVELPPEDPEFGSGRVGPVMEWTECMARTEAMIITECDPSRVSRHSGKPCTDSSATTAFGRNGLT